MFRIHRSNHSSNHTHLQRPNCKQNEIGNSTQPSIVNLSMAHSQTHQCDTQKIQSKIANEYIQSLKQIPFPKRNNGNIYGSNCAMTSPTKYIKNDAFTHEFCNEKETNTMVHSGIEFLCLAAMEDTDTVQLKQ